MISKLPLPNINRRETLCSSTFDKEGRVTREDPYGENKRIEQESMSCFWRL